MISRIEDLDVYKYAYDLILAIYGITKSYPVDEKFGLVSQMRRAAISVNANMSEGGSRISQGEQKQFLGIARGSVAELRLHVCVSRDIGLVEKQKADELMEKINTIHKVLTGLINK